MQLGFAECLLHVRPMLAEDTEVRTENPALPELTSLGGDVDGMPTDTSLNM